MARLKAFALFWYHFFVGDDWLIAAGVVVALAATYILNRASLHAWWIVPVVAVILLVTSVARAARRPK